MQGRDESGPGSALAPFLIAQGEVVKRLVLAAELRDAGFFVVEASNADDAMAYLKTGSQIDLVFSDIQMPGSMDGLELARRLRVEHPSLPVILSSAHQAPKGVAAFISKPYKMERVVSAISKALRLD